MVFVSILTPVYNGVEFLEECIDSVIKQTFIDWELLIGINGHGEDGGKVAQIVEKISEKDTRIKVIIQPPPLKGKVESLNNLMTYTQSEWICLLDCDDKWHPYKLEAQYKASINEAKDASVIGTLCQYFGERHDILSLPIGYIKPDILENFNPIINSSAMIRSDLCKWEYNEINNFIEDYYLWTEICLANKKLYNVYGVLTYHRIHRQSAFNSQHLSNDGIRERYKRLRYNN